MTVNAAELCIGPAFLSVDGDDIGLTDDEGFEFVFNTEEVEFKGAQSVTVVARARNKVEASIKGVLNQLTLANLAKVMDVDAPVGSVLTGAFPDATLTQRDITLQMAGPNGATRVLSATGTIMVEGTKLSTNEYAGLPFEIKLLADPSNGYELFRLEDTAASSAAPTISSYDTVSASDGTTETDLADADTDVPVDEWVQIVFDKTISVPSLSVDNFSLTAEDANADVALDEITYGQTGGNEVRTKVVLKPTSDLANSTKYNLRVSSAVRSTDGYKLAAPVVIQFTTEA